MTDILKPSPDERFYRYLHSIWIVQLSFYKYCSCFFSQLLLISPVSKGISSVEAWSLLFQYKENSKIKVVSSNKEWIVCVLLSSRMFCIFSTKRTEVFSVLVPPLKENYVCFYILFSLLCFVSFSLPYCSPSYFQDNFFYRFQLIGFNLLVNLTFFHLWCFSTTSISIISLQVLNYSLKIIILKIYSKEYVEEKAQELHFCFAIFSV